MHNHQRQRLHQARCTLDISFLLAALFDLHIIFQIAYRDLHILLHRESKSEAMPRSTQPRILSIVMDTSICNAGIPLRACHYMTMHPSIAVLLRHTHTPSCKCFKPDQGETPQHYGEADFRYSSGQTAVSKLAQTTSGLSLAVRHRFLPESPKRRQDELHRKLIDRRALSSPLPPLLCMC